MTLYTSVVGAVLVVLALRHLRGRRGARGGLAAIGILLAFSQLAETVWAQTVVSTPMRIAVGMLVLVSALGVWLTRGQRRTGGPRVPVAACFLVALAFHVAAVNVVLARDAGFVEVFARLVPLAVWIGVVVLVAHGAVTLEDLAYLVVLTLGVAAMATYVADRPWVPCTPFKCSDFGQLFVGIFRSENSLARLACLAAVLSFATRNRAVVAVTFLLTGPILLATESRTSQAALVAALVAALAAGLLARRHLAGVRIGGAIASAALVVLGLVLVHRSHGADFSNRGYIWTWGREAIRDSWVLGSGIDNWSGQVLARNYMHSEALYLLYAGGAVAVGLYVGFLVSVSRAVPAGHASVGFGCLMLICALGLLEVVVNPAGLDGTAAYLVALLVLASSGPSPAEGSGSAPVAGPAQREERRRVHS